MKRMYKFIAICSVMFLLCSTAVYAQGENQKVNINTATAEQLIELPGIGDTTAERIIQYRESNGNFNSKDQLLEVKGIGDRKFEKLRSMVTL